MRKLSDENIDEKKVISKRVQKCINSISICQTEENGGTYIHKRFASMDGNLKLSID
jgi:hypothetical protein